MVNFSTVPSCFRPSPGGAHPFPVRMPAVTGHRATLPTRFMVSPPSGRPSPQSGGHALVPASQHRCGRTLPAGIDDGPELRKGPAGICRHRPNSQIKPCPGGWYRAPPTTPRRNGAETPVQTGLPIDYRASGTGASATNTDELPVIIWLGFFAEVLAEMLASGYITRGPARTDSGVLPLSIIGMPTV